MTGVPDHHDATSDPRKDTQEPVRYPTNHLLAVVDTPEQLKAVVSALTGGGFLESEVEFRSGAEHADQLGASSGRGGLAGLILRFAERIGVADEELETKYRYEQAMRENRFVVSVAAPTEDRKTRATELLREHGAHTIAFMGAHSIEYVTSPNNR